MSAIEIRDIVSRTNWNMRASLLRLWRAGYTVHTPITGMSLHEVEVDSSLYPAQSRVVMVDYETREIDEHQSISAGVI